MTLGDAALEQQVLGMFASHDLRASSEITRKKLGWNPTGPGLLADLERMDYSEAVRG